MSRELAREHGPTAAILLQFLSYKLDRSEHHRNGLQWYYCTLDELRERFPYIPRSTVNDTLKDLETAGLIRTGNFNRHRYDKTRWYTIPDPVIRARSQADPIYFDVQDAIKYGIVEAIVLGNLKYWTVRNRRKDLGYNYHRFSAREMAQSHLPFSPQVLSRALKHLLRAGALRERARPGWDRAKEYSVVELNGVNPTHGSNPDIHGAFSDIHGSFSDIHESNPNDDTHYIDTIEKTPKNRQKNTETPTSSSSMCALSPVGGEPVPSISQSMPNESPEEVPSAADSSCCGHRKQLSPDEMWELVNVVTLGDRRHLPLHDPERIRRELEEERKLEEKEAQIDRMHEQRTEQFRSKLHHLQDKADLSAKEKVNVVESGIQAFNRIGLPDDHWIRDGGLTYTMTDIKALRRFFAANPHLPPSLILDRLEACAEAKMYCPLKGYDPELHRKHCGADLGYFLIHLTEFLDESGDAQENELIQETTFLNRTELYGKQSIKGAGTS